MTSSLSHVVIIITKTLEEMIMRALSELKQNQLTIKIYTGLLAMLFGVEAVAQDQGSTNENALSLIHI